MKKKLLVCDVNINKTTDLFSPKCMSTLSSGGSCKYGFTRLKKSVKEFLDQNTNGLNSKMVDCFISAEINRNSLALSFELHCVRFLVFVLDYIIPQKELGSGDVLLRINVGCQLSSFCLLFLKFE